MEAKENEELPFRAWTSGCVKAGRQEAGSHVRILFLETESQFRIPNCRADLLETALDLVVYQSVGSYQSRRHVSICRLGLVAGTCSSCRVKSL